jgi:hypothetical protein
MIQQKVSDCEKAKEWRTGKEIMSRGYFNGDVSIKNTLVHVIMHEFAHHIQTMENKRLKGSVHNDGFYEILDRFYRDGEHEKVMNYLEQFPEFSELKYEKGEGNGKKRFVLEFNKNTVNKGQIVTFKKNKSRDSTINGFVIKTNLQSATVISDNQQYSVPYCIIQDCKTPNTEQLDEFKSLMEKIKSIVKKRQKISFKSRDGYVITGKATRINGSTVTMYSLCGRIKYSVPYSTIINGLEN